MRRAGAIAGLILAGLLLSGAARAADRYFQTSDGVRLHYVESGRGRTIVMVPGWTMPAWIFDQQIRAFSRHWRVVAFDPRAQGASEVAPGGYDPQRRGQDIAELLDRLGPDRVLLVGWSLGVLDSLAYVSAHGDDRLAGLVLVDNSVGEEPAPTASAHPSRPGPTLTRAEKMRRFVAGMFVHPQPRPWLDRLTAACLRTPPDAASALLAYAEPRSSGRKRSMPPAGRCSTWCGRNGPGRRPTSPPTGRTPKRWSCGGSATRCSSTTRSVSTAWWRLHPPPRLAVSGGPNRHTGAAVPGVAGHRRVRDRADAVFRRREVVGYGYWVISIVLAGFALSGVVMALARDMFARHGRALLSALPVALILAAAGGYHLVTINPFNPLQLQNPATFAVQLVNIAGYYAVLLPFFFLSGPLHQPEFRPQRRGYRPRVRL